MPSLKFCLVPGFLYFLKWVKPNLRDLIEFWSKDSILLALAYLKSVQLARLLRVSLL